MEWLVANGLGGFASGPVSGPATRRYHGLLVAALPAPCGRAVLLDRLDEALLPAAAPDVLGRRGAIALDSQRSQFRLVSGLPEWRYETPLGMLEKRIVMPRGQNTVHVVYRLRTGTDCTLLLKPHAKVRVLSAPVDVPLERPYTACVAGDRYEIHASGDAPPLRLRCAPQAAFLALNEAPARFFFASEAERGYAAEGYFWTPGEFVLHLPDGGAVAFSASAEPWDAFLAFTPEEALQTEERRRDRVTARARAVHHEDFSLELTLAADAFIVTPAAARVHERSRARAKDDDVRSIIAGYHWFTEWGRDTMVSLEGITLVTGRHRDARLILRTYAGYMRDGLIPNFFPEGDASALYHTADATLWFFHALSRYVDYTGDTHTVFELLPKLVDAFDRHVQGTRFGIGVDPADGLLRAGSPDYPLTWMDAQVGDWIVTPRRGKPVEVNALWYNALRLLAGWLAAANEPRRARYASALADRVYEAFNRRFWLGESGYLCDVIDGKDGDDPSFRPNQLLAISLPHPVLARERWAPVLERVRSSLLTPRGLRTLAPDDPQYQPRYDGDRRARDAAYHQGTVWPWLFGPFCDASAKTWPEERGALRHWIRGMRRHLREAGMGYVSEIFDAEPPFGPRGCIAQAWSVAELLRVAVAYGGAEPSLVRGERELQHIREMERMTAR